MVIHHTLLYHIPEGPTIPTHQEPIEHNTIRDHPVCIDYPTTSSSRTTPSCLPVLESTPTPPQTTSSRDPYPHLQHLPRRGQRKLTDTTPSSFIWGDTHLPPLPSHLHARRGKPGGRQDTRARRAQKRNFSYFGCCLSFNSKPCLAARRSMSITCLYDRSWRIFGSQHPPWRVMPPDLLCEGNKRARSI